MAKHKYYKYNVITGEVIEEYLETDEDTLILMENPIMEMEQESQNEEIVTTQDAVNFLLMGTMSSLNKLKMGGSNMGKYLANQIYRGKLDYDEVIAIYPQFKAEVDAQLESLTKKDGLSYK